VEERRPNIHVIVTRTTPIVTEAETRPLWEKYVDTISGAVASLDAEYPSRRSLWIDVIDLYDADEALADALFRSPDEELATAAAVVRERLDDPGRITVRIENHPALLRVDDLRARHLGELVSVEGIVHRTRRRARLDTARFRCRACGSEETHTPSGLSGPAMSVCPDCGTDALVLEEGESTFVDTQIFHVEPPGESDGTRSLVAHIDDDLAGAVRGGDGVVLTGVLRPDPEVRSNVFDAVLSAVSVDDATTNRRDAATGLDGLIDAHWREGDHRE
jgi:DNA replicative helicase MCM subunit Mcm2 (Cdc46/Mcm family)